MPGHPFAPEWLPPVAFGGADAGVVWNDISPRLGVTCDLMGTGKTVVKASYALYYGQRSPSQVVNTLNPVTAVQIRFPWTDLNGDSFVTRDESISAFVRRWSRVTMTRTTRRHSDRPAPSIGRQERPDAGVHRGVRSRSDGEPCRGRQLHLPQCDRFTWDDKVGLTSANYVERTFTPSAASCPAAGARCDTVTFFEPNIPVPGAFVFTNVPDRCRDYNGVEFQLNKRCSNKWMGLVSFAFNDASDHWDSRTRSKIRPAGPGAARRSTPRACPARPTRRIRRQRHRQHLQQRRVDVQGAGDVRCPGTSTSPSSSSRVKGYPFPQAVRIASRANRGGLVDVLLEPLGDTRHPT